MIVAGVVSDCAIYDNSLQGKSSYATQVTASAGVQPYGNSFDFIVDSNTISQTCNGIYMWGMSDTNVSPLNITCDYFNYVANNTVDHCLNGIVGVSQAWGGWPTTDPYPGISYLGNTCTGNTVESMSESGLEVLANTAPIGDQVDLNVFDANTVSSTPAGINLEPGTLASNAIVYKNVLSTGAISTAAKSSPATSDTFAGWLK